MNINGLTYMSTMCTPKINASKFVAISILMHLINKKSIAYSLEFVSLHKKNNRLLLLLPEHMQTLLFYQL